MKKQGYLEDFITFPIYLITHPFKGFTSFKEEKKGKMKVALFYLLASILVSILQYKYTGPVIGMYDQSRFSSLSIMIYTITPIVILSVANWSITTLMNGKGTLKQIFMLFCYAQFPTVIIGLINIILSNLVTTEEAGFIYLLGGAAWFLTGYLIFMGFVVLHEYGLFKTITTIVFTGVATMVMLFIALLIYDLAQQIYGFLYSLYYEITSRYF